MSRTSRPFWLIADDYGLSPGVCRGILQLAAEGRLSGTGCMTLFADWPENARRLRAAEPAYALGLHLTLTDFPAASGAWQMPSLRRLIAALARGAMDEEVVMRELDAQLDRFTHELGMSPAFIDGHQHVHYLAPVRRWLARRFRETPPERRPWLRAAPSPAGAPAAVLPKVVLVRSLAAGFDRRMRKEGFAMRGPLSGFYDWRLPEMFAPAMRRLLPLVPEEGVVMCHPGHADTLLRRRDALTDAREEELRFLSGPELPALLKGAGLKLALPAR